MTFLDPFFWGYFIYFLLSIFLSFFIPGDIVVQKIRLPFLHRIIVSFIVGMVFWGLQGFLFGHLGVRWMSYVYLAVCLFIWITYIKNKKLSFSLTLPKERDYIL